MDEPSQTISPSVLTRARSKDEAAWQKLTHLYVPLVAEWCRRAGLQQADADDLTQDVFRSVYANLDRFRRERSTDTFRGWLWTITQNRVRDWFRSRKGRPTAAGGTEAKLLLAEVEADSVSMASDESGSVAVEDPSESGLLMRRAVEMVRADFEPRTWQAFWETAVEARAAADVGAQLGLSTGAVYVARSRVLRRLREELGDIIDFSPADSHA